MRNKNTQIDAYRVEREIKHHDVELLNLIKQDLHTHTRSSVLDIGCAAGAFIGQMSAEFPQYHYTGFDISSALIDLAKAKNLPNNCEFFVGDAIGYQPQQHYDIVIASGVLSIFDDFRVPLKKWLSWLNESGKLYIFGRFNSKNIDTIIQFRNNHNESSDWEGGLTSYATKTVEDYCQSLGFNAVFHRFKLPIKLNERDDPIRTYTIETADGNRLVVNGANIIAEQFFCCISKAVKN